MAFAEEDATLKGFWEQLFIDLESDEWGSLA